jgi:DNA repair protein RecO (recombination protein O)
MPGPCRQQSPDRACDRRASGLVAAVPGPLYHHGRRSLRGRARLSAIPSRALISEGPGPSPPRCDASPTAVYRPDVPIPRRYTTDAIVLTRFDYGEADRILTLITPGLGKLKAIAKGIRRPTSRLGGSLEPFAELRLALARGRTFDVVTQVSVVHPWLNLRDDLVSFGTASYMAELANGTLEERHASESVYLLLKRAYEILDAGMAPSRVARWFEMHLADELGVRPEVDRCVECGRLLEADERYRWVPPLGGVLCERCPGPPHERVALTLDGLKLLKAYQRMDVEALATLRVRSAVELEIESAMREFLAYTLDRSPRSLAFLDEVRATAEPGSRSIAPVPSPARIT